MSSRTYARMRPNTWSSQRTQTFHATSNRISNSCWTMTCRQWILLAATIWSMKSIHRHNLSHQEVHQGTSRWDRARASTWKRLKSSTMKWRTMCSIDWSTPSTAQSPTSENLTMARYQRLKTCTATSRMSSSRPLFLSSRRSSSPTTFAWRRQLRVFRPDNQSSKSRITCQWTDVFQLSSSNLLEVSNMITMKVQGQFAWELSDTQSTKRSHHTIRTTTFLSSLMARLTSEAAQCQKVSSKDLNPKWKAQNQQRSPWRKCRVLSKFHRAKPKEWDRLISRTSMTIIITTTIPRTPSYRRSTQRSHEWRAKIPQMSTIKCRHRQSKNPNRYHQQVLKDLRPCRASKRLTSRRFDLKFPAFCSDILILAAVKIIHGQGTKSHALESKKSQEIVHINCEEKCSFTSWLRLLSRVASSYQSVRN